MRKRKIAIIGMGYVGLPLALNFGKIFEVMGFDIDQIKIQDLKKKIDKTKEHSEKDFSIAKNLIFSSNENRLDKYNTYIITVPTPVDQNKVPDLTLLVTATALVSKYLKKGDTVIFESTVYPGTTNDTCIPLLAKNLNKVNIKDIDVGFSPERINPGDKVNNLANVVKLVGCDNKRGLKQIANLYRTIIDVGVEECESIKIAEGAKIIENIQRDVNIGLVNELKILFDTLNIDFDKVLKAARTKWNFIDFKPGLVGGHCIGIDPYYLTHLAKKIDFHPEMILAGRRINDSMAEYHANVFVKKLIFNNININNAKILVLGFAFKKNCTDSRNTKVNDLINHLKQFNLKVDVFDPLVNYKQVYDEYNISIKQNLLELNLSSYKALLIAVEHEEIMKIVSKNIEFKKKNKVYFLN